MISKKIFYLLFMLMPVNLGKHLVLGESYVSGILVDYLIPVLYVSDILAFMLVCLWAFECKGNIREMLSNKFVVLIVLFLFSVFLSGLLSENLILTMSYLARFVLYSLVGLYVYKNIDITKDLRALSIVLAISLLFVSTVGILQFINQHAVFNNYLFLGEQPYNKYTYGLTHEFFLGRRLIPAYGLFRHPNIFGGYLSVVLVFLLFTIKTEVGKLNRFYFGTFLVGLLALLCTLSYFSYLSFLMGVILIWYKKAGRVIVPLFVGVFLFSLSLPLFYKTPALIENSSVFRRAELLMNSYDSIRENLLYGVGLGTSTQKFKEAFFWSRDILFIQPAHNIFVLIFEEAGLIAFVIFLILVIYALIKGRNQFTAVLLFQLLFLGCFDHYIVTVHQTTLLFFIVLGMHMNVVEKSAEI